MPVGASGLQIASIMLTEDHIVNKFVPFLTLQKKRAGTFGLSSGRRLLHRPGLGLLFVDEGLELYDYSWSEKLRKFGPEICSWFMSISVTIHRHGTFFPLVERYHRVNSMHVRHAQAWCGGGPRILKAANGDLAFSPLPVLVEQGPNMS